LETASTIRLTGFQPIVDIQTRCIIVGTFPGVDSLSSGYYYANEENHFWDIMYRCLDASYPPYIPVKNKTRSERYQLLLKNKIGLWDIIESCERNGSNDSKIRNPKYNDFDSFLKKYTQIEQLVFNGSKAHIFFKKSKQDKENRIKTTILYSTSTMSPLNTFKILEQWLDVFQKKK
jgi:hypoxanthine-DNA glycosylase